MSGSLKQKNMSLAAAPPAEPPISHAQTINPPPVTGLYISLGAGGNIQQNEHLFGGNGTASNASIESRIRPVVLGAIGKELGNGIRLESEGGYRNKRFSEARNFGYPAAAGGNEVKYGPMFNATYGVTGLIPFPHAALYGGLGAGYQWSSFNSVHTCGSTGFPRAAFDDNRGAFAYQALSFPFSFCQFW